MSTAFVLPLSRKAKNRFANVMNHDHECIIEQRKTDRVFLTSVNGKYHFWASLINDPDWAIEV